MVSSSAGALVALVVLVAASACGSPEPVVVASETTSGFGVEVVVDLVETDDGLLLRGSFVPAEPDLHLYDTAMADSGIDGIGRPTRITPVAGANPSGPIEADAQAQDLHIEALDLTFPVYPDGPVRLEQPVVLDPDLDPGADTLEVSLTWMACSSDGGCKPPVVDRIIQLPLPSGGQPSGGSP